LANYVLKLFEIFFYKQHRFKGLLYFIFSSTKQKFHTRIMYFKILIMSMGFAFEIHVANYLQLTF